MQHERRILTIIGFRTYEKVQGANVGEHRSGFDKPEIAFVVLSAVTTGPACDNYLNPLKLHEVLLHLIVDNVRYFRYLLFRSTAFRYP